VSFIEPQGVFGIDVSIQMVLTCIMAASARDGPLLGGVCAAASEWLRASLAQAHLLVYGVLVIAVIL